MRQPSVTPLPATMSRSAEIDRALVDDRCRAFTKFDAVQLVAMGNEPCRALATPFPTWNAACLYAGGGVGVALGWFVLLGGLGKMGKTLAALSVVASALRAGVNVLYLSLEMSREELHVRLAAQVAGADARALMPGAAFDERVARDAYRALYEMDGTLWSNPEMFTDLEDLNAQVALHAREDAVTLVIVDYAQLIDVPRRQGLAVTKAIAGQLKAWARNHRIAVLALVQFRRGLAYEQRPPTIQDIRDGTPYEATADQVVLLDHTTRTYEHEFGKATMRAELVNRHGPGAEWRMTYDYRTSAVREAYEHETWKS